MEKFQSLRKFLKCEVKIIVPKEELFEIKSNNRILKEASKDIIVLFQDDMICQEPLLREKIWRVINHYGEDNLGLLGGRDGFEFGKDLSFPEKPIKKISSWAHGKGGRKLKEGEFAERTVLNRGPLVFTRSLIDEVGYLCEKYYPQWGDDMDYSCEAKFKYNRTNVVFQCNIRSELKWGGTRTSPHKRWLGKTMKKNWSLFVSRWGHHFK